MTELNGKITKTKFSPFDIENITKKQLLNELDSALTKLEGYATKVNNCDCTQIYSCQTMRCQIKAKGTGNCNWNPCQSAKNCIDIVGCQKMSCQYFTCQKTVCQQGTSCQTCQACEKCQVCETCESQCLCQTCQTCQKQTYDVYSCQQIKCQSCQTCQVLLCENVSCQARKTDGRDLV